MPRPKKDGAPEPKTRSRKGCWPCKSRKVKCDEAHPSCMNCQKQGETCDYSIRLNWGGRGKKSEGLDGPSHITFANPSFSSTLEPPAVRAEKHSFTSAPMPQHAASPTGTPTDTADTLGTLDETADYDASGTVHPQSPYALISTAQSPQSQPFERSAVERQSAVAIDPLLMNPSSPMPGLHRVGTYESFLGQSDHRYSQSYERYHSAIPTADTELPLATLPRVRRTAKWKLSQNFPPNSSNPSLDESTFGQPPNSHYEPSNARPLHGDTTFDKTMSEYPYKRFKQSNSTMDNHGFDTTQMPPPQGTLNSPYELLMYDSPRLGFGSSSINLMTSPPHLNVAGETSHGNISATSPSPSLHGLPDPRRLSVESLLSGPPGMNGPRNYVSGSTTTVESTSDTSRSDMYDAMTFYGVDRGFRDLDIGKNDDFNAITGDSPAPILDERELDLDSDEDYVLNEFGFGVQAKDTAFEKGGYYSRPVTIEIAKSFEPLPSALLDNPMNLLYFHHFISHTARILVPHHCSANPFQNVLPRMALQDENLMNLLLAYSASHRARLLQHPEPATRIALWVQDVFPNLRHALDDPTKMVSNANLATAIMLASLEIISPKAFGVAISWQQHLDTARQMILARGGTTSMHRERSASTYFLLRWFGYLDVMGSLTGGHFGLQSGPQSMTDSWTFDYITDEENEFQINCLLGFSDRCVSILTKIARLAQSCAIDRLAQDGSHDWAPSEEIKNQATVLVDDLEASRTSTLVKHCPHLRSTGEATYQWDNREMAATNEAYHFAGLVHLHRRILGKQSQHPDVQSAVREIIGALYKVRRGSTAEACLLFPMFTAGCDTQDEKQRGIIMERLKGIEEFGLSQVHKARTLLQKVWDTGKPWEALTCGEFVG